MINVLLVDDYPIMRQLLRDILARYPDVCIVGEALTHGGHHRHQSADDNWYGGNDID